MAIIMIMVVMMTFLTDPMTKISTRLIILYFQHQNIEKPEKALTEALLLRAK